MKNENEDAKMQINVKLKPNMKNCESNLNAKRGKANKRKERKANEYKEKKASESKERKASESKERN
ncbi:9271_t:CDS:2 [Dentiscutata heterogama]|uniref:9271_t:CDS:1 n=1 Tax=Dentiscutata heterogama TaxID=1316150 RepID=A0ACA9MKL3_9GLOM|nr:9271_t:CDS:2 [Dentiscutata heterogama]